MATCFAVGDASTINWWCGEAYIPEKESKSNSGCWELYDVVLYKDLHDFTVLLCGKAEDGLGIVGSQGNVS